MKIVFFDMEETPPRFRVRWTWLPWWVATHPGICNKIEDMLKDFPAEYIDEANLIAERELVAFGNDPRLTALLAALGQISDQE